MTTVPPGGTPPEGSAVVPPVTIGHTYAPRWRGITGLTTALTALFWFTFGAAVLLLVAAVNQRVTIEDVINGNTISFTDANNADNFVAAVAVLILALMTALAVLVIVFMWRASKNLQAWGRTGARLGPGWSIGSWFIPLANLVMPVLIVQDLWRGSDPAAGRDGWRGRIPGSALVGVWWAAWVVTWLLSGANAGGTEADTFNEAANAARSQNNLNIAFALSIGTSAVLAASVFRSLGRRFDVLRTLPPEPAVPAAPPAHPTPAEPAP